MGPKKKSIIILLLVGLFSNFIPHPANCSALLPLAYLAGVYYKKLTALFFSLFLSIIVNLLFCYFYNYTINYIWLCFSAYGLMNVTTIGLNKKTNIITTFQFSFVYWFVTNWYVWMFTAMYPLSIQGFFSCYYAAIPFLLYSFIGNIFWLSPILIRIPKRLLIKVTYIRRK